MDFYNNDTLIYILDKIRPIPEFVKQANIADPNTIPANLYALPEKRAFPIYDPASCYLSFGCWMLNKNKLSNKENKRVKETLVKAAAFHRIHDEILSLASDVIDFINKTHEKQASRSYALAKTKEYPLHSPEQVMMAIEEFPHHADNYSIPERQQIATMIVKQAEAFGLPVMQRVIIKYASPRQFCRTDQAACEIMGRGLMTQDPIGKALFQKLGSAIIGNMTSPDIMYKLAGVLEKLDQQYNTGMDYYNTIFNITGKQALDVKTEEVINVNGDLYKLHDLAKVPPDKWEEIFGEDFVNAITGPAGKVEPDRLKEIINTLPLPEKNILNRYLKQWALTI